MISFIPLLTAALLMPRTTIATGDLNFLVMGDWGGIEDPPYTTPQEVATAAGMNLIAGEIDSEFSLALGDNFYTYGIPTDVNDMRFNATFENVYNGTNLQG